MNKKMRILVACGLLALSGVGRGEGPSQAQEDTFYASLLLDEDAVFGCGHAALLFGNEKTGWHYVSFAPRPDGSDNVHHLKFASFAEARDSEALARYDKYLLWNTIDSSGAAKAQRRLEGHWKGTAYDPFRRNCFHMVADIIRSAGFSIDADYTIPVAAYEGNRGKVQQSGRWPGIAICE